MSYNGSAGYHPKQIAAFGGSIAAILCGLALSIGLPLHYTVSTFNTKVQTAKAQACAHDPVSVGDCLQKAGLGPQYVQYGK